MYGVVVPFAIINTNYCCWYLFDGFSDDFSRVKLKKIKGEEGSDYINASFLDVRLYSHCYYYEDSAGRSTSMQNYSHS